MRSTLLFSILTLLISSAIADNSVSIDSGMWEVTTTMTTPMSNQPQIETTQECMEQDSISVDDIAPGDDECTATETNVNGDTLTWSMECSTQGGAMSGGGSFTSKGDSGHGSMQMNMTIQGGQTFNMEMAWEGKRIGSC